MGRGDQLLARLLTAADEAGVLDWAVAVDSTIARAHQHATRITRLTGAGSSRLITASDGRAAV